MAQPSDLHPLDILQPFQHAHVLRPDVPRDDILDEPDLLRSVFEPVQLRDDLIPLVHQISPDCL